MFQKNHIKTSSIFAILLVICSISYGQKEEPRFRFELFDLPNGIAGNHVQSVTQDAFGFMWFGSQNGLHRWDGYHFKTYLSDPADSNTLMSNYIEHIYVAKDSTLWLCTWGNGLDHFDPQTETFTHYLYDPDDPKSLSSNFVNNILEDDKGDIWVATQRGLNRLDKNTGTFKRFIHDPNDPNSISYDQCGALYFDSEGTLWIGTGFVWEISNNGGLNRYHPETETFTRYQHDPADPKTLISNKVIALLEDSKGQFWVGTDGDGLHQMDRKKGTFTRLKNHSNSSSPISSPYLTPDKELHTRFIFEDQDQKLWIGAWKAGIKYIDPESNYVQHYFSNSNSSTIPDDKVWNMYQSRDGTLWGWTAGNTDSKVFKIVQEKTFINVYETSWQNKVLSFFSEEHGIIWIGTKSVGLLRYDPVHDQWLQYSESDLAPFNRNVVTLEEGFNPEKEDQFDNIAIIEKDMEGNLWQSKAWDSKQAPLMRFNPISKEFKDFRTDPADSSSLSSNRVSDILRDQQGRIWIACADGVLNLYVPETDQFRRYALPKPFSPNSQETLLTKLTLAQDGSIWLAGGDANPESPVFLLQFNPQTASFRSIKIGLLNHSSEDAFQCNAIQEDPQGDIWICSQKSLIKVDPYTEELSIFKAQDLNCPEFHGMVIDEEGQIWLSANKVINLDPETSKSLSFSSPSRIDLFPFSKTAIHKSVDGEIFIGGKSGFLKFDPVQLKRQAPLKLPEVLISEFRLLGSNQDPNPVSPTPGIWEKSQIKLTYNQNVFSFHFAALDFLQPEATILEYQMEGFDNQWRRSGLEPVATYIKVPPGHYTFNVRATNRFGIQGATKSVDLVISPPWWLTWWALGAYLFIIGWLVYWLYRYQLNRRLAVAEAHRLKELDSVKTKLYTNITHEFRTPLTVIMGMVNNIQGHPQEKKLIQRNSENLLRLINQLLDLSKLDSGMLKIHATQADIVAYMQYLTESFYSMAEENRIRLTFYPEVKELIMDFDEEKIQHIVYNLLSNALKFTPEEGKVILHLQQLDIKGQPFLQIKVSDTGKGIQQDDLLHIFDRFYQIEDSSRETSSNEGGTGIGLALTKELVELMDGRIAVESKVGLGTDFMILLPVRRETDAPKKEWENNRIFTSETPLSDSQGTLPLVDVGSLTADNRPTLLIIEDNRDVVIYIQSILQKEYQIEIERNGRKGIEKALEMIPDIIISDIMMPEQDGYDVCHSLKNDERTSHIPIILLTAKATTEDRLRGLQSGADAYLTKPFNKEELFIRLDKLVELRKALQDRYSSPDLFKQNVPLKKEPSLDDKFLKKLITVVQDRLDDPNLAVVHLCKAVNLSNMQVNRKLKALTGKTPSGFIRFIRLQRATDLLKNTELNISEIAYEVGFNDPNYFSRSFSEEFGFAPNVLRK